MSPTKVASSTSTSRPSPWSRLAQQHGVRERQADPEDAEQRRADRQRHVPARVGRSIASRKVSSTRAGERQHDLELVAVCGRDHEPGQPGEAGQRAAGRTAPASGTARAARRARARSAAAANSVRRRRTTTTTRPRSTAAAIDDPRAGRVPTAPRGARRARGRARRRPGAARSPRHSTGPPTPVAARVGVGGQRALELLAVEVGPQLVREVQLRVGGLPQQEVGQPQLAAGADDQLRVLHVGRVQVPAELLLPAARVALGRVRGSPPGRRSRSATNSDPRGVGARSAPRPSRSAPARCRRAGRGGR